MGLSVRFYFIIYMMRYILFSVLSVILISSCDTRQVSDGDMPFKEPEMLTKIDSWHKKAPELANAHDSASFIIGFLNGNSLSDAKKFSEDATLKTLNDDQFFKGVAMALEADTANVSLFLGIMAGMELMGATKQYSFQLPVNWDNTLILRGYYHGLKGDITLQMPSAMIEAELNKALNNIYQQNKSNQ